MENESKNSAVVLDVKENVGVVQIADDVVAMIASLAATEVEGVSAMAGTITNELMGKNLAVTMEYGYNIPATCHRVQAKVKSAIENMTGLGCTDVNIRIAGVKLK